MMIDIGAWVEDNLDNARKSSGQEWTATCPSCGKWSKFYVNVETGHWICFSEEEFRGKAIWSLIAYVEGITVAQARAEALRGNIKFARRRKDGTEALAGRIAELRGREAPEPLEVRYNLPIEFVPVYDSKRAKQWMYPKYLKTRGIKRATARSFGLGFCRGGRYDGRIVIPIVCPNGYSFTARGTRPDHIPKYLNPKEADHSRLLIGWEHVDAQSDVCLVEGPTDVIMMHQHGIPSLALGGKELHDRQLGLLCRKPVAAAIIVMLDPEETLAAAKVARKLGVRFQNVYIGKLPLGVDPGSSTRKQAWAAFDNAERYAGQRTVGMLERLSKL